jgi:protein-L-isoaspartate(D-aspartate) O-methyltransferase
MADFARQRLSMVESQLRTDQVTDPRLLAAMGALPRELFVPASRRAFAYMDEGIEVLPSVDGAPARYLLAPMVLAKLIQLADVEARDRVLDVGCATGYATAVLARLAGEVVGVEPEPKLAASATKNLAELGFANVRIVEGALAQGHAASGPYDVIVLGGSVPEVPEPLLAQLKDGGRLAAVIVKETQGQEIQGQEIQGLKTQGKAYLFVKVEGKVSGQPHFDAGARPLPGLAPLPSFAF